MEDKIKELLYTEVQRLYIEEKEDKNTIHNLLNISLKYPSLLTLVTEYRVTNKDWEDIVREALFFENNDIRYMYDRTMQIVRRFKEVFGEYFEIKNQLGTFLIPDRLSDFNRLFQLYEDFFYNIYPRIVNQLNVKSFNSERNSNIILGKINWNKTIVRNFLGGESTYPINFTTLVSESNLHNPENILFLSYIIRIGIDSKFLNEYKFKDPLTKEEKSILENIINGCNKLISDNMVLQPILQQAIEYANLTIYDMQLPNLENKVVSRIRDSIVRQKGYISLINWIAKYRELNIRVISPNHTNFPVENVRNLDTMFELWILFELLDFIHLSFSAEITKEVLSKKTSTIKFKIKCRDIEFYLFYQKGYDGWTREVRPDFTIEVKDELRVILDAKNWIYDKNDAINKMLAYLNNLDGDLGVLFFPNSRDVDLQEYNGATLKNHKNQRIINCVLPLSGKDKIEQKKIQLEKLFNEKFFLHIHKL